MKAMRAARCPRVVRALFTGFRFRPLSGALQRHMEALSACRLRGVVRDFPPLAARTACETTPLQPIGAPMLGPEWTQLEILGRQGQSDGAGSGGG